MAAGDVNVNALTTITSEPTSTDSLVAVNRNTNEGQIIDYNLLADKILSKLTSKTYSGLSTTSKLLVGAINELDSDVASLNSRSDKVNPSAYINNVDLNNYTTSGLYAIGGPLTNNPDTQTWFGLIVIGPESAAKQMVIARNKCIYKRYLQNGTWSAWQKFTGTAL